jgi:predicted GNAT family N-acyltransferase
MIEAGTPAYAEMVALRMEILLGPIGIPRSYINEDREKDDHLIGAYSKGALVGCCILTPLGAGTLQLRQMAVAAAYQQQHIGAGLVAYAEALAAAKDYGTIVLHARDNVIPFYQKSGYAIDGDRFFEVGIPHHKMKKALKR